MLVSSSNRDNTQIEKCEHNSQNQNGGTFYKYPVDFREGLPNIRGGKIFSVTDFNSTPRKI